MDTGAKFRPTWATGLSARLLGLTILFVMLAEVLIYVPSVSRFRKVYLEEHLSKAHIAVLALQATPDNMVSPQLEQDLLYHAQSYMVALKEPSRRTLMLGEKMPPEIDKSVDLVRGSVVDMIMDAFEALVQSENRILRVVGPSPREPGALIEVILDETPMREEMIRYSVRILTLSVMISLITATFVYLSLTWLIVRPMMRICDCVMLFRENPEDDRATLPPTIRGDEIGIVQRELAAMQRDLRVALHQKTRLAALGAAVAKINHDLKNTLASAVLASDGLADIQDPEVKRLAPQLYGAIDRAVSLCGRTLDFARSDRPLLKPSQFMLGSLIDEAAESVRRPQKNNALAVEIGCPNGVVNIEADREQLYRTFQNLFLNAARAGATRIAVDVERMSGALIIDVRDNGPGIPAKVQEHLFQPFAASANTDGSGLGLVIAREIVHAHGGEIKLVNTDANGTTFRLVLPQVSRRG